ncbi:MAG: hypothetical protein J6A28_02160 [Clostridia bacterium]|nr:hypothetical protein [Clostridia bacterium]
MKVFGIEEEDLDLRIYGVPQYVIDYVRVLKNTYPNVAIRVPIYEKALKIQQQTYGKNYSVRYCIENLPKDFDFDSEYYAYLKSLGKKII